MNRYQILIEYVGTSYSGWQIQKKGKTIQGKIQKANFQVKSKIKFKDKSKINLIRTYSQ